MGGGSSTEPRTAVFSQKGEWEKPQVSPRAQSRRTLECKSLDCKPGRRRSERGRERDWRGGLLENSDWP